MDHRPHFCFRILSPNVKGTDGWFLRGKKISRTLTTPCVANNTVLQYGSGTVRCLGWYRHMCAIFQSGFSSKSCQQIPPDGNSDVLMDKGKNDKAIPVTGSGNPQGCEMSRISPRGVWDVENLVQRGVRCWGSRSEGCEMSRFSHFLDSRHTDGGKASSFKRQSRFILQEYSWYSFLL
jgi:hypothetical protein